MGTRADFYVGRGEEAEWLGSVAWDGYPDGISKSLLRAKSEDKYREEVQKELSSRDDATLPENGWPWPWIDSHTTDYAYAFDEGKVWATCFGNEWFIATHKQPKADHAPRCVFPDMSNKKKVTFGKRSGLIIITKA